MAQYTGIQGQNILIVSSDPSNPTEGQIWYNTTSNLLKGYAFAPSSVATGGNMNTSRRGVSGAGTQTAALAFGGFAGSSPYSTASESYNGTSWTSTSSIPTSRYNPGGCGTQTAALGVTGSPATTQVISWDGSSWTNSPVDFPITTLENYLAGIQTACITCGVRSPGSSPDWNTLNYSWNGSSWTSFAALNTIRSDGGTAGNQTSALVFGGEGTPASTKNDVELWNGTSWTTKSNLITDLIYGNNGPVGTSNDTVRLGGLNPPNTASSAIQTWNGTSWASDGNAPAGKSEMAGSGSAQAGLYSGGAAPPYTITNTTFEYTGAALATKTITTS